MNDYLIPANTKSGKLILGIFTTSDLILFGVGILTTILCLTIFDLSSIAGTLISLAPAFITGFLVIPIPNYHNMLTVISEMYNFFTNRREYKWRGWCYKYEQHK